MKTSIRLLISVFAFILALNIYLFSQQKDSLVLKVRGMNGVLSEIDFKKINEGIIHAFALDQNGKTIKGLTNKDFVFQKLNKKAIIDSVIPLVEVQDTRMKVLLLIDNSYSMNTVIKDVTNILDTLISSLGKGVKICAAIFDRYYQNPRHSYLNKPLNIRMSSYTKDKEQIRRLYRVGFSSLSNNTLLYDEIYTGFRGFVDDTTKKVEKNFAIVLSDGADIGSSVKEKDILENIPEGLVFYNIDFMHSNSQSGKPNTFLKNLAIETGGEYYNPKDIHALSDFFRRIATQIIDKGYQICYSFPAFHPAITDNLASQKIIENNLELIDFKGLVVEDIIVKESFPLLNYIFFNEESDSIPERYVLLKDQTATDKFTEKSIKGDALMHYYNVMNIIGKRYQDDTSKSMIISGYTDGKEKGGKDLAQRRMEAIKRYFESIWKISGEKIITIAKILPDKRSSRNKKEGLEENRRVEIYCDSWQVLKPVTFEEREFRITPKEVEFSIKNRNTSLAEKADVKSWEIDFYRNGEKWRSLSGDDKDYENIVFDWKHKKGEIPKDSYSYSYKVKLLDNGGETVYSPEYTIPVKQIRQELIKTDGVSGKKIEKISLVLFEFNKYDLGERNDLIMKEFVFPRLYDSVYVIVNGYTDNIGQEEANLKLSINRATAVSDKISDKTALDHLFYEGFGATKPLYDNNLPEGRFYNRTVQLLLQNFPPDAGRESEKSENK